MKNVRLGMFVTTVATISFFSLAGIGAEQKGDVLAHGIAFQSIPLPNGALMHVVIVEPGSGRVRLVVPEAEIAKQPAVSRDRLPRALFLSEYASQTKALAVLSGGYMSSFSPPKPLGAIRVEGRELSAPHRTWLGTGIFCTDGSKFVIGKYESLATVKNFPDCIQSGPLVINGGAARYSGQEKLEPGEERYAKRVLARSFLCLDSGSRLIAGVSGGTRSDDLSRALKEKLNAVDCIGLSGGETAGLYVRHRVFGNDETPLYDAIAIYEKSP